MDLALRQLFDSSVLAPLQWTEFWLGVFSGSVGGIILYEIIFHTCLK